ncbi:MAG: hypothetical protein V1778_01700, partial [bacterium]
ILRNEQGRPVLTCNGCGCKVHPSSLFNLRRGAIDGKFYVDCLPCIGAAADHYHIPMDRRPRWYRFTGSLWYVLTAHREARDREAKCFAESVVHAAMTAGQTTLGVALQHACAAHLAHL